MGWLDNTEYFFLVRRTHIHTHIYGKEDETVEYTYRPTTKLHAGLIVGNTPSQYHTLPKWDDFTTLCVFFIIYLLHTHTYTIYRRRWMRQGNALACQQQYYLLQLVSRSKWFAPSQLHTLPKWDDFTTLSIFFFVSFLLNTHKNKLNRGRGMKQENTLTR